MLRVKGGEMRRGAQSWQHIASMLHELIQVGIGASLLVLFLEKRLQGSPMRATESAEWSSYYMLIKPDHAWARL